MEHDPVEVGREVIAACRALGFALAGIAEASATSREDELRAWLAAGKHGSMDWMEELLEERIDPRRMLPGARSMVMVGDVYSAGGKEEGAPGWGRVARYARGRDYHVVIKRRLHRLADQLRSRHPGHEFRSFVDTGPVLEREHAARAGLGWIGKHTLLIHPRLGTYMLLGGMATTLELRRPQGPEPIEDACGTCTRCIDACPTGAITPYSVDARRCISYLTIEHSGRIEDDLSKRTGDWAFGCDVCQQVCPFNRDLDQGMVNPAYRGSDRRGLSIVEVLGWKGSDHEAALAGTAQKRASLAMLKRNAALAAGNAGANAWGVSAEIVAALERTARDEGEEAEVREAARLALSRLEGGGIARQKPSQEEGEGTHEQKTS